MTNKACGFELPPGRDRMAGYGSFGLVMDVVAQAVSQSTYITGETFSAADVFFGSQIGFWLGFKIIDARPAFVDYWERIRHRPARVRAEAIDNALIAEANTGS